jgi:nuclear pore complex protein Nup93
LDNDVDGYISNLHSQSTLSLIQEGLEQSKRDFDLFLEENVQIEWDAQRKRIYDHFGLGRQSEEMAASQRTFGGSTARGAFGRSTRRGRATAARGDASVNGSSFGASGAPPVLGSVLSPSQKGTRNGLDYPDISGAAGPGGPPSRSIREKQERFMDKVKELNETRLREAPYPVFHGFKTVETASNEDNQEHILNAYDALISITGESENTQAFTSLARPKARSFAKDYLSITADSPESVRIRKRIVNGSRKYLEERFLRDVEEALLRHAKVAEVGGVPGRAERIRGYVRVKVEQRELGKIEELQRFGPEGHEYPWVIIFFFLRGGLTGEAAEYVRERRNFFQNNDRNFIAAVQHYHEDPDHRLTLELQQKINQTFAQRARISPTNDPYRMACYKIIGRCEITRRNLEPLPQSMDDWIWLQFNLAREVSRAEENAGEAFGLEELRASIEDIGKRHFTTNAEAAGGYGVYFYLATLGGMFEHAVDYLYQHNYMSAIHIAIALDYYGLLRVSNWSEAGLQMRKYCRSPGT